MSKLRCHISISLDGFVAGPNQSAENPLGAGGERLHEWVVSLAPWRESHGHRSGEVNESARIVEESRANIGAAVMDRNMFGPVGGGPWADEPWTGWWGENPPYHYPVLVLTHHVRGPVEMEGGTTFHFVTDGIESALDQARKAAHGHDVMLWGGAQVANQDLAAGLLDELELPGRPYEIPERHRRAVRLMTPADTFPYSTSLDPDQIDHTEPYQHRPDGRPARAGQSRIGNYGPMTTPHHRLKTFGRWTIKQPFPGIYLWRDPHGALYLVDHTGTRPLPRDERRVGRMTAWVRSSVGTRT